MDEIGRKEFIQDLKFWMKEDSIVEGNDICVISEPLEDYGLTINEVKTLVRREFGYEVELEDEDVKIIKRNYFGKIMLIDYGSPNTDGNIQFFNKDDINEISVDENISKNTKKLLIEILENLSENMFVGIFGIPFVNNNNEYTVTNEIFKKMDELKENNNDWEFIISSANDSTIIKVLSNWSELNNKLYFVNKKIDMDIDNFNTVVVSDDVENFVAEKFALKLSQEFKNRNWDKIWQIIHEYFILEDYSVMLEKLLKIAIESKYYIHI